MSNSGTKNWPEVQRAFETKRYELILVGSEISKRIEDNGGQLDESIFKLKNLNFLEIARTKLSSLPKKISLIENLTSFLCHSNELAEVPAEIGLLKHLKNLDLSNNKIGQLPAEIGNLTELFTVNLSGNQLTSLFPLNKLSKLAVLNISRNSFKSLPDDLGSEKLEHLAELNASFNQLEELSENLVQLASLKLFNLENNNIKQVPANLCQCIKLKDLLLKENKLKDNRLKKLVDQNKMKPIIEYLERIYAEELKKKSQDKSKAQKKKKHQDQVTEYDLIKVYHCQDQQFISKEIRISDSVNDVRPFILCAIFRSIDLETAGNLKKFLSLQTKLHEEDCQKRTLATIATHDLQNIKDKLCYMAEDPTKIELVPLGRKYPIQASEYFFKLLDEAEAERKAKKRNQLSGIYKYLTLVEKQSKFAFLEDSEAIISLPPLTNADKTRMSPSTKEILVEITSSDSLDSCKKVMEKLIIGMFEAGVVSKVDLREQVEDLKIDQSDEQKLRHIILVQQVRLVDSNSCLKSVYPSRVDLNLNEVIDLKTQIKVLRMYEEN
ncbi:leucine-rich repeat-containing 47-like [Brachionus plicatilis]|uniref:Leucine-rich repeat-containing 47-like n=1 Tax=Brachionus plicatilis TaxID=10195 RepID=A0A3M7PAW5_BRAPC|nr:leucine-rich repeat-containing 47-like [Brachionus plicatilis]